MVTEVESEVVCAVVAAIVRQFDSDAISRLVREVVGRVVTAVVARLVCAVVAEMVSAMVCGMIAQTIAEMVCVTVSGVMTQTLVLVSGSAPGDRPACACESAPGADSYCASALTSQTCARRPRVRGSIRPLCRELASVQRRAAGRGHSFVPSGVPASVSGRAS